MTSDKKAIIFDLDGTLVDTMHIFADVASQLISENYGIARDKARDMYFETSGLPFCQQIELMFLGHELNSKITALYETGKIEATADIKMDKETREALRTLEELGYDMAISSNNFERNVQNFVNNNNLNTIFALALGFREEGFGKGKPHFDFIKDKMGYDGREMVFVGDALNEARIARDNGLDFIAKLGTFGRSDFLKLDKNIKCIQNISDLII